MEPSRRPLIEIEHVFVTYPGTERHILNDCNLTLYKGEHAVIRGGNGAGKSTLMSVLFGLYQAEEGTIRKDGVEVSIKDPNDANALGIGMVVCGAIKLGGYFSKDLFRLAFQYDLAFGILLIALGVLVLLQPDGAMSFFCIVLGICVLTDGLFKIQIAIDAKRFGITKWWIVMVMAILTVAMGIVLVLRPGESAAVIMLLAGIGIFVEGLLNICVSLCMVKIVKNQYPDVIEGDYEVEE